MKQTAILFSGQGAQYEGMGRELAAASPAAKALYDQASESLKLDLLNLGNAQLSNTRYAQTATFTLSLAAWAALREKLGTDASMLDGVPMAGFSLGEYTALTASGVIGLEDALKLLDFRSEVMAEAASRNPGAMYAIIGLDDVEILMELAEEKYIDRVFPANFNSPGQLVIAGYEPEVSEAAARFKELGAKRALRLDVSGAFHTPLMQPAADRLKEFASRFSYRAPDRLLFSNVLGDEMKGIDSIPSYLARHMVNPVRWTATVRNLALRGITQYIELGPGKTLIGLVKRIASDSSLLRAENPQTLEETAQALLE